MQVEKDKYLHGFTETEQNRLYKQARFVENKIYNTVDFSGNKHVLEIGSGVGAQTEILLRRFPELNLTCIEYEEAQIERAKQYLKSVPYAKGRFDIKQMNAKDMDFASSKDFDGAFICWVLEHIPDPSRVLLEMRRVLIPGSQVILTEVLNSTFFVEPYSPSVLNYWLKFNDLQYDMGGDPFVGAKLGNLLQSQGFKNIETETKTFHLDNRNPAKRAEMINFWTELLLSALPQLIEADYVDEKLGKKVAEEMRLVSKDPDAVFFYSFIQAKATT